jgi:hypothetical protein
MAKKSIRQGIRKILNPQWINVSLEISSSKLNPKIRGWMNYYGKYFKWRMIKVLSYLDGRMRSWISKKYKITSKAKQCSTTVESEKKVLHFSTTGNLELNMVR